MELLSTFWLPVVLSGVALFFASFLAWMVLPHHKGDFLKLPDESAFENAIRGLNISPGNYMFPYCSSSEDMKSESMQKRMEEGPTGTLALWEGAPQMGRNMFCTFLFFLVSSYCLAYLADLALQPDASFMEVFRFVGTAGILTYAAAGIPNAIWFRQRMIGNLLDGVAYGLIVGAIFAAFWPEAIPS